jgi:hypothetical protein
LEQDIIQDRGRTGDRIEYCKRAVEQDIQVTPHSLYTHAHMQGYGNHSLSSTITPINMRRSTSMNANALFGVLLLTGLGIASGVAASNLDNNQHSIFNPDTAAAFKVGLANVASNSHSRLRRANAFGSMDMDINHRRASSARNRRQNNNNNIGDLLGDNGDILDINDIGNNALALEVVTSGSTSTTLTSETVYVTTLQGERSECEFFIAFVHCLCMSTAFLATWRMCCSVLALGHSLQGRVYKHADRHDRHTTSFLHRGLSH